MLKFTEEKLKLKEEKAALKKLEKKKKKAGVQLDEVEEDEDFVEW